MNKVCYLTRIKDEEKLIFWNLLYYYNLGIRNFYITFNNSNKATISLVERFVNKFRVNYYPYHESNTEYNQIERFDQMSDFALSNGHCWQIPSDADELLVLKNTTLQNLIKRFDRHEYGYIQFRWVDFHPTSKDDQNDVNFFTKWQYREVTPRGPSKIIYKWSNGCRHGHGNHLLIQKRRELASVALQNGFYAHFVNRERDQIAKKRKRIGEAFIQKYGENCDKPQVKEYRLWEKEGDVYFDRVWEALCEKRKRLEPTLLHDPIPKNLFSNRKIP